MDGQRGPSYSDVSADAQGDHQLHRRFYCGCLPSPPCPSLVLSEAVEGEFPIVSPFPLPISRAWQTRGDTSGMGQPLESQWPEWDPRDGRGQPQRAAPSVAHTEEHTGEHRPLGTAKAGVIVPQKLCWSHPALLSSADLGRGVEWQGGKRTWKTLLWIGQE